MSLHFPRHPTDGTAKVPWFLLVHVTNNPIVEASLNYSIVDDLAQSPSAISALEVLITYPFQCKYLLSALGVEDTSDSCLINFNLDQG